MAFAGLTADARILIDRARVECQSHRLTVEDKVTIEYITRYIAQLKQKYTQSNGRRPFGIAILIAGFDDDGTPRLFQTDPSGNLAWCLILSLIFIVVGVYHSWKANATGRNNKSVLEFLEKNYSDSAVETNDSTIKLAIKALLEVVQGKNLEVTVMERGKRMRVLSHEEIDKFVTTIEKEKEEEMEKKKTKK